MGVIPGSIRVLSSQYPRRDKKEPEKYKYVETVMTGIPGTPCCAQMSHALNMAGIPVPLSSYRRTPNPKLKVNGRVCNYLLATDELEEFLQSAYGEPETINRDFSNKTRSVAEIKAYIKDRPGILIFRQADLRVVPPKGKFEHTEIWNGTQTLQRDMNEDYLFGCPRVLMWDANDPAKFLVDYMSKQ
ncbi:MAG TPA: T6SS effector amidase Tae4 family protein [Granulicella sp.]